MPTNDENPAELFLNLKTQTPPTTLSVQELLPIVMVMQSEKVFLYRKCQANNDVI